MGSEIVPTLGMEGVMYKVIAFYATSFNVIFSVSSFLNVSLQKIQFHLTLCSYYLNESLDHISVSRFQLWPTLQRVLNITCTYLLVQFAEEIKMFNSKSFWKCLKKWYFQFLCPFFSLRHKVNKNLLCMDCYLLHHIPI